MVMYTYCTGGREYDNSAISTQMFMDSTLVTSTDENEEPMSTRLSFPDGVQLPRVTTAPDTATITTGGGDVC